MAIGAVAEPLVVVTLLFGGAWFNRNREYDFWRRDPGWAGHVSHKRSDERHLGPLQPHPQRRSSAEDWSSSSSSPTISSNSSPTIAPNDYNVSARSRSRRHRRRRFQVFGVRRYVSTPDTQVFRDRLLSRVLHKFPFLVEAWYWALLYWVYQLGRAFTALTLVEGTVHTARKHALQIIHLERRLHIFWELPFQRWFLDRPSLLHWINRVYSFIHIPGTIFFLVALYYMTTTRKRQLQSGHLRSDNIAAGPDHYEARRRTMAVCNLIAFIIFTIWPCMPPRLLSDPDYHGEDAAESQGFGFVDTVHSQAGESSVWTTNRFCNQYAAMPSLHFGYSLLIGVTIATLPINNVRPCSWKRAAIVIAGLSYPALILTAIVATANHFILDAVAGLAVCAIAWKANGVLLNLCIIEDYFLSLVRIHKPVNYVEEDGADYLDQSSPILLPESV